jgi:hypothetical protein
VEGSKIRLYTGEGRVYKARLILRCSLTKECCSFRCKVIDVGCNYLKEAHLVSSEALCMVVALAPTPAFKFRCCLHIPGTSSVTPESKDYLSSSLASNC